MVNEWATRETPAVLWGSGIYTADIDFWELTEGRCEYLTTYGDPVAAGYGFTNKTLSTREAYFDRWEQVPNMHSGIAYDIVRFILPDSLERAGTTQVDAVIEALETIDVETSRARHFVFTSSHDIMAAESLEVTQKIYQLVMGFQWQNGEMVIVYPKEFMEEAGATYKFPDWPGPWD